MVRIQKITFVLRLLSLVWISVSGLGGNQKKISLIEILKLSDQYASMAGFIVIILSLFLVMFCDYGLYKVQKKYLLKKWLKNNE